MFKTGAMQAVRRARGLLVTFIPAALAMLMLAPSGTPIAHAEPVHAIAMHGSPSLPADYTHFLYTNPKAPKGGEVTYGVVGSFDSLNPFILKSMRTTARGVIDHSSAIPASDASSLKSNSAGRTRANSSAN